MITRANYSSESKKIDFSKLSDSINEGHKFYQENEDLYDEVEDVAETVELYLTKLNAELKKQSKPVRKAKSGTKAERDAKAKALRASRKVKKAPAKPKTSHFPAKKTRSPKNEMGVRAMKNVIKAKPQIRKDAMEWTKKAVIEELCTLFKYSETKAENLLAKHIDIFEVNYKSATKKEIATSIEEAESQDRDEHQEKDINTKTKRQSTKKKTINTSVAKGTAVISVGVALLKRFVKLINKDVIREKIRLTNAAIQRAITLGQISKSESTYPFLLRAKTALTAGYNTNEKSPIIKIEASDATVAQMVAIAGGEEAFKSVSILKAFIALQGKEDELKAKALLKRIEKGSFEEDPFYDKIKYITKILKSGKWHKLSDAELNGLQGLVGKCCCHSQSNYLGLAGIMASDLPLYETSAIVEPSQILPPLKPAGTVKSKTRMTAEEVANMKHSYLSLEGEWKQLFGDIAENFKMMFFGIGGSGKTTLLLQFAEYLTKFGKVLYASSEEIGTSTLTSKVNDLGIKKIEFEKTVIGVDLNEFQFVFLDSINHMKIDLERFKQLKEEYPQVAFILVVQSTKDGGFRGGQDWEHEVDIAARMKAGTAITYKNRFGTYGTYELFKPRENQGNKK